MNVIGISGLANSVTFKRNEFPDLSERDYGVVQGLDSAAALADGQGIIAAAAEERFTGQKATGAFPIHAIRFCLQAAGLAPSQVDLFAHGFSYEPVQSLFDSDDYSRRQYAQVFSPERQKQLLEKHFGGTGWSGQLVSVPHHLAHAASAFYPSGLPEALILVSDGMGEAHSATVAMGWGSDITVLAQIPAFHSLGVLYGVFTLYLGLHMNSDEYKVMGLAPYGNPRRFYDAIMDFVSLKNDGTYTVPLLAKDGTLRERETHAGVLRFLEEQFGPARQPGGEFTAFHQDIAAALQAVLQACQMHVLKHFRERTGQKNLCMAGGVALNCSANGVIRRSGLFERVFVQPAAGDDGSAIGAALYAQRLYAPRFHPKKMALPLWGPEFSDAQIREAVQARTDCRATALDSFESLCAEVAERLERGEVIAWFQGRMEFGPRALGSRSILADPRDAGMRDRINSLVKKRESFRPFAPVVTSEAAAAIFDLAAGDEETYAHMLFVTPVRAEFRERLPAITHVDGSARIQTVAREHSPRLWQLLKAFEARTGLPVLLNTSFNVKGQPIVCTPQEAVDTFLAAHLDLLVMGNMLITPAQPEPQPGLEEKGELLRLKALYDEAAWHEEFWVRRLGALSPVALPYRRRKAADKALPESRATQPQAIPQAFFARVKPNGIGDVENEMVAAALGAFLARITGLDTFDLGFSEWPLRDQLKGFEDRFGTILPLRFELKLEHAFSEALGAVRDQLRTLRENKTFAQDLFARYPALQTPDGRPKPSALPITLQVLKSPQDQVSAPPGEIALVMAAGACWWSYEASQFDAETISGLAGDFAAFLHGLASAPGKALTFIPLLRDAERSRVLFEWNGTRRPFQEETCIHEFVAAQARSTPEAIAAVFEDQHLTYTELDRRADLLARHLRRLNVGPDVLVGLCMEVSLDMLVGLLGVLKAGGAYVPLDPDYPRDRLGFMIRDARLPVLLTQERLLGLLPEALARATSASPVPAQEATPILDTQVICIDSQWETIARETIDPPPSPVTPRNLAYVIYTSGSTGKPKGVMVTHRNVANFFAGMDERISRRPSPDNAWLAVTSISFDISVLELFWTLARGFKVVLHRPEQRASRRPAAAKSGSDRPMDLSLFYFASDESAAEAEKYRLLLEGARFADAEGFAAVWTPERHFHAFGGLYPNPAVTGAAIAAITSRIQIRAGSVVLPLHNTIRVAEEWAMVDNLSNGRVGVSIASGWRANDFVLAPQNHAGRKDLLRHQFEILRRLWRGETVNVAGPDGTEVPVRTLPRPIQPELPLWLTASGNPETFRLAGELGVNVLTHLLGQTAAELAQKILLYRAAWRQQGHAGAGRVTLMLHTFVGEDLKEVREVVRGPMTAYLRSSIDLIKNAPQEFTAFKCHGAGRAGNGGGGKAEFSEEEMEVMAGYAFERYFENSGLFGTPARCVERIEQLRHLGVDEVACLIDFGLPTGQALAGLRYLNQVKNEGSRPQQRIAAGHALPALVARHRVSHLQCTPSLASLLAEEPQTLQALQSLHTLLLGGEALSADLLERLDLPGQILNMYGPTETTIWSTTHALHQGARAVLIGRPIANTVVYVMDKNLQPVPIGVPGELLIGGAGVVRGYLNRPELTAEKFIPNPFAADCHAGDSASPLPAAERLYRTGDLVRYLPDGTLEFLGRIDQQVKLRGFRIELGEIETALRLHQKVKECAAAIHDGSNGDKRLVAYIVPASGQETPAAKELREFLGQNLPDYMVPVQFITLTALPLTPNGKLDRKALPAPRDAVASAKASTPPATAAAKEVAKAWCAVLGLSAIGLEDNFFELGGNSILATQLVSRLRQAFGCELPLNLAFESPTLQAQADSISAIPRPRRRGQPEHEPIGRRKNPAEAPLSFAQQRLWFLDQLEPGPHYNDHFNLRLTGPLNARILEQAINEIVRRHDTLRATFQKVEGSPVQIIAPALAVPLAMFDLSDRPEKERQTEAARLAVAQARQPFRLDQGPLVRATLLRLAREEHLLSLTLHHIVIDGWSRGVLLRELAALYDAFGAGSPSPLPEPGIQYADFAAWQRERLRGEVIEEQTAYWKRRLQGAPPLLALPANHPRPATQTYRGARAPVELDRAIINRLSALGRQEGCTLFMVLLAAFQALLARYTGREDIIVGSPVANRNRSELEGLIGFFLNSLVLRADLSGDPTFLELLQRVRQMALEAYAHQDLPLENLLAELQPVRDLSYSPLFQVMFVFQNAPFPVVRAGALAFDSMEIDTGISKYDLTLSLADTPQGCGGWVEYSTDLFEAPTIYRLIGHYKILLESLGARPEIRLSQHQLAGLEVVLCRPGEVPDSMLPPARSDVKLGNREMPFDAAANVPARLARIWSEILGVEKIDLHDNLFDLGAHSLLITKIMARIEKVFSVEVPIQAFFETPTLEDIARIIEVSPRRTQTQPISPRRGTMAGVSETGI